MTRKKQANRSGIVLLVARVAFIVVVSFPLVWMVLTSFKSLDEFFQYPLKWLPSVWKLQNYQAIFTEGEFLRSLWNSLVLSVGVSVVAVSFALLAAYGFDRFRFKGRNALLFSILGFQFFPLVVLIIPYYMLLNRLRLIDTLFGLFLAYLPLAIPTSLWMLRSFIKQVPHALEEAALIDGCSTVEALFRVTLPAMTPQVISTFLLSFVTIWEEYMMASILTSSAANRTMPLHLSFYMKEMTTDWGSLMAASVVMTLPLVIPFIFLSGYFRTGLTAGGVKG